MVETKRIELSTSRMRTERSPSWATSPQNNLEYLYSLLLFYKIYKTLAEVFL